MMDKHRIELINWLNRKIAEAEHSLSKIDPMLCSRSDEMDEQSIRGMICAYETVKKYIAE